MVALLLQWAAAKLAPRVPRIWQGVALCIIVLYSWRTLIRNPEWSSETTLYESGLRELPNNCKFHYNYATTLQPTPENEAKREHHFRSAVAIYPKYTEAWINLGTLLIRKSRTSEALDSWDSAITQGRDVVGADKGMAATNAVMAAMQIGKKNF